jgi:hypothetical protein
MQTIGNGKSVLEQAVGASAANRRPSRLTVFVVTIALSLAVFAIEVFVGHSVGRRSLFYPVIFACAWFGGFASGVGATLLSAALVWWQFVPPEHSLIKTSTRAYAVTLVFVLMGVLISWVVHRGRLHAAELARNYRFLQTILDHLPETIVIKDLQSPRQRGLREPRRQEGKRGVGTDSPGCVTARVRRADTGQRGDRAIDARTEPVRGRSGRRPRRSPD